MSSTTTNASSEEEYRRILDTEEKLEAFTGTEWVPVTVFWYKISFEYRSGYEMQSIHVLLKDKNTGELFDIHGEIHCVFKYRIRIDMTVRFLF